MVLFFLFSLEICFADSNLTNLTEENISIENNESNLSRNMDQKAIVPTLNQIEREKIKQEIEHKKLIEAKKLEAKKQRLEEARLEQEELDRQILSERLSTLLEEKEQIDFYLAKKNLWNRIYLNHETYQKVNVKLNVLKEKVFNLKSSKNLSEEKTIQLKKYEEEYDIMDGKLSQLTEYSDDPFKNLTTSPKLEKEPSVTNPIDIITAVSFEKQLDGILEDFRNRYATLEEAVIKLKRKNKILEELVLKTRGKVYNNYVDELRSGQRKVIDFEKTLKILKTSVTALSQNVSQVKFKLKEGIEHEIKKSIVTGSIILFLLLFFFFIKYLVKKYMSENELYYGTNKVINFIFIALVFVILLFSYIEDVENLVTVLSFASAGIAIALKDWFMSLMGWVVILVSGSIHVGDRVKFVKDGVEYVGDIVDISVLRMTLHEDVTLTTIYHNRRTGRMIFIPNNYIFTDMIANYSHSGLKTVWDGIDFMVTFDSNIAKAQNIAKDVTRKYSKGYTDMTRKQLNRLRSKYSMRNTAVEPRVFGFFDVYGVKISAWYLTNAYATLTLRSTISMEILSRLKEEDDIFLAFPSQSIFMEKPAPKNIEEVVEPPLPEEVSKSTSKYKPDDWGLY